MDYQQEQDEELEVLQSIYPDELEVIKRKYPDNRFQVSLKLELPLEDSSILTKEHIIQVYFQLPSNYPDEVPIIILHAIENPLVGLQTSGSKQEEEEEEEQEYDDHGNKITSRLHDNANSICFDSYIPELQVKIEENIKDNMLLGMQMCFTLLVSIKDYCESWYLEQFEKLEKRHEKELHEREKEEQRKFLGTVVTSESFLEWRTRFRQEFKIDQRDSNRRSLMHHGKLTGRQIFEKGLAGEEDGEGEQNADVNQLSKRLGKTI